MMPGSTMKIVTAATAAELLGWDYRFETKVVSTVPIDHGVLRGDLIVVGGGDPSISERSDTPGTLRPLARQVRDAGITRIEGGIIGDDDVFDDHGVGNGWTLDNLPYGYSAPVSALEYNEGSVDLVIRAGTETGMPVAIQVRPEGSGVQIDNQLVTVVESGTGMLTLQRHPGSSRVIVQGQIPAKAAPFVADGLGRQPDTFLCVGVPACPDRGRRAGGRRRYRYRRARVEARPGPGTHARVSQISPAPTACFVDDEGEPEPVR